MAHSPWTDVVKALCLGARACSVERLRLWTAAAGEAGVNRAIEFCVPISTNAAAAGLSFRAKLDRSYVEIPKSWDTN